ncbi:tRNA-dihydrouridine(20a/20b) synthase [NAD(P)+]-like [Copidosoma floridanum]|uniref:tRNA-dihydrouridine(20a/20b) synthase [NAD(P)+]-like n=1 Tax=Copidosoma floridanum TaxID=29053 RepID=UPI0006C9C3EB|nr:tRNA-dihydrouridine(20a/20b) synthase [NAD(P)+]-like [Copidosoma floridanum]
MSRDILDMLTEPQMTKVCAPMVRYSKLPFRTLMRKYDCDLCFTPMILADAFVQSSKARDSEFSTSKDDRPLVVQFAANEVDDYVGAAELIAPYADGVDLNCGCPQRWAMKDGYGADLLTKPQLVKDMVYQVRNRIPQPFTVSVKIRLLKDLQKTIDLCRIVEKTGVSFVTVHARTPDMRNEPIDLESLKLVRSSVQLPVIANGNVRSLKDAVNLYKDSKCNGVMVASALLANPALFSGSASTPVECVQDWLDITSSMGTPFMCMHHHLVFMLDKVLTKQEKQVFNVLKTRSDVYGFLEKRFNTVPETFCEKYKMTDCKFEVLPKKIVKKTNEHDVCSISLENLFI